MISAKGAFTTTSSNTLAFSWRTVDRAVPAREAHHALPWGGFQAADGVWTGLVRASVPARAKLDHVGIGQGGAGLKQTKELGSQSVAPCGSNRVQ
jgi:hypothetical protein